MIENTHNTREEYVSDAKTHDARPEERPSEPHTAKRVDDELLATGYEKALELMTDCAGEHGFLASPTELNNYRRVWGRDGCILGIAALRSGEHHLIEACRRTIETLAKYQGPHGEIPSNVDPQTQRVSYGGTAGRVDANLWFVICAVDYCITTNDNDFLQQLTETLERVRFLLGAWEFNTRGLLYVPLTGDWADEYVQSGYVLYDQLLYLQALRSYCDMHYRLHATSDHQLMARANRLRHLIRSNYWLLASGKVPADAYHEALFSKSDGAVQRCRNRYWVPFFSPAGYGYRFDTMANALVSLLGVADKRRWQKVDEYVAQEVVQEEVMVLPAFYPTITPQDEDWEELQMTFSYTFRNKPNEYHNGGLWPLVTGFYVADLAGHDKLDLARKYLAGIHRANAMEMNDEPWGFPEFLHGEHHTPGGTHRQGWSAAAAIIAQAAIDGYPPFRVNGRVYA